MDGAVLVALVVSSLSHRHRQAGFDVVVSFRFGCGCGCVHCGCAIPGTLIVRSAKQDNLKFESEFFRDFLRHTSFRFVIRRSFVF